MKIARHFSGKLLSTSIGHIYDRRGKTAICCHFDCGTESTHFSTDFFLFCWSPSFLNSRGKTSLLPLFVPTIMSNDNAGHVPPSNPLYPSLLNQQVQSRQRYPTSSLLAPPHAPWYYPHMLSSGMPNNPVYGQQYMQNSQLAIAAIPPQIQRRASTYVPVAELSAAQKKKQRKRKRRNERRRKRKQSGNLVSCCFCHVMTEHTVLHVFAYILYFSSRQV